MGLESATYIGDLVQSNPLGSDDKALGDNHLRLIKGVLKTTFPNASRAFRFPSTRAVSAANIVIAGSDDQKLIPVDCSGGARSIQLVGSLSDGFSFEFIKTDSSAFELTITAQSGSTVNGASSISVDQQFEGGRCVWSANDSKWYVRVHQEPVAASHPSVSSSSGSLSDSLSGKLLRYDASSGAIDITVPTGLGNPFNCEVMKVDSSGNAVNIKNGSGTVLRRLTGQYQLVRVISDGSNVYVESNPFEVPVGGILFWPVETPPGGFLRCEGQALAQVDYPALYTVLGNLYGASGSTFNLPDLRGEFIRVWDNGKGRDPDAGTRTKDTSSGSGMSDGDKVGTQQLDELKSHTHSHTRIAGGSTGTYGGGSITQSTTTGTTGAAGGNETRPLNRALAAIIRVR